MQLNRYLLFLACFLTVHMVCRGQQTGSPSQRDTVHLTKLFPQSDTTQPGKHHKIPFYADTAARKRHDPRKATIRSAIIPGWGQIYNHKYWKLPIVYAAIGIPVGTYIYNRTWYRNYQQAISIIDTYAQQGIATPPDSVIAKLPAKIQPLVALGSAYENDLRNYRNEFRKDEDYSALFFLLFWGLNVVDATVDAHLMYFDVSDELSMHLQQPSPGFMAPGIGAAGVSIVFDFHKARSRQLSLR